MEAPEQPGGLGDYRPARYGRACQGCAKAKCKCFIRAEGAGCERCYRLGKSCEPTAAVRVRKSRPSAARPGQEQALADPVKQSRLEEKLDQIVSLLNSADHSGRHSSLPIRSSSSPGELPTPESLTSTAIGSSPEQDELDTRFPDAVIDVTSGIVQLLGPGANSQNFDDDNDHDNGDTNGLPQTAAMSPSTTLKSLSPVLADIGVHHVAEHEAVQRLNTFRKYFLPIFPFVHIPSRMTHTELRLRRPFLWLVIMALASKSVTEQYHMEATIWNIISRRALREHHDNVDLLLGIMGFTAWNCYFKEGRPYMNLTTGLAVALAGEIGIQRPRPGRRGPSAKFRLEKGRSQVSSPQLQLSPAHLRLEERRTMLGVFRLSSMTWKAYRKLEPIRWTPYLDECLRILAESGDSPLDALLVAQVKCDRIVNELTIAQADALMSGESGDSAASQSSVISSAMLRQLEDIRRGLPRDLKDTKHAQFVFISTELTIRDICTQTESTPNSTGTTINSLHRLRDLDVLLTCVTSWFKTWLSFPSDELLGVSSESHCDFFHACVVLFKLTTLGLPTDPTSLESLPVPGWEASEVRCRADVLDIVEKTAAAVDAIPRDCGIVDAQGPRRGAFFKIPTLVRGIGLALKTELLGLTTVCVPSQQLSPEVGLNGGGTSQQQQLPYPEQVSHDAAPQFVVPHDGNGDFEGMDVEMTNYLMRALQADPWFSDIFPPQWDAQMDLDALQGYGEQIPDQFAGWEQTQGFDQGGWTTL